MLDILVFNVELGQCIFFYPRNNHEYGLMVDCGDTQQFKPVDFLIDRNFLHHDGSKYILKNLTLTNYDHDHYSGLPYLQSKVKIKTVRFPKNITPEQIDEIKPDKTKALDAVINIRKTYISNALNYNPPYKEKAFYLELSDFDYDENVKINDLSQLFFLEYNDITVCIPGDLEEKGWKKILDKPNIKDCLYKTDIFFASHHGRENGFCSEVFEDCFPECIIMSDTFIKHGTQENMSSVYGARVVGNGITFNDNHLSLRKVLTTRNDGHIHIRITDYGEKIYKSL